MISTPAMLRLTSPATKDIRNFSAVKGINGFTAETEGLFFNDNQNGSSHLLESLLSGDKSSKIEP